VSDIMTERSGSIFQIQFNRPTKKNAMTSAMYVGLADLLNQALGDKGIRAVLWYAAGDAFCAGNDVEDFLKNPLEAGETPQSRLMKAFLSFDKPLIAAVQGFAVGGGATMLTHCDFVYAGQSAKFQMPFINLALVPEFGTSWSLPAHLGYLRAAELILLGIPYDAKRALELGLVTSVVPDQALLTTATQTAQKLADLPSDALRACKRLMRQSYREQIEKAMRLENDEYPPRLRSADAKEALTAFLERRPPNFARAAAS
jgi:enoyl-CoA hydratase/carnithine racemase